MSVNQNDYNPPPLDFNRNPRDFEQLRQAVTDIGSYLGKLQAKQVNFFREFANSYNNSGQGFGADLASAATISPTTTIHVVTGTATVSTILIPPGFNGALYLISKDGFSSTTGGNIAQALTFPASALVTLVYVPQKSLFYVTDVSIPDGSITTAKLAAGAATEGTPVIDATIQPVTPYDSFVTVASNTVTINAASDFVHLTGRVSCTVTNAQSTDQGNAQIVRDGVTVLDQTAIVLTLSTATVVGGTAAAAFSIDDNSTLGLTAGAHTYTVQLLAHNGSGNGTFSMIKNSCWLLVVDHKAQ